MRIVHHAQHLTGVGNAVLPRVIADALACEHDVFLVDGGRFVPGPSRAVAANRVRLPVLQRARGIGLVGEHGEPADEVFARRATVLTTTVDEVRPDVVIVDHYPFSKWELESEIVGLIDAARRTNAGVRVVASLRDISARSRYEQMSDQEYGDRVTRLLGEQFDALVVHSDPSFLRLDDSFPYSGELPVPLTYSGFVVEPVPETPDVPEEALSGTPHAVLSTGGIESPEFLAAAVEAFGRVAASGALGEMRLHAFAALGGDDVVPSLRDAGRGAPVTVHPFSESFTAFLHTAALSISRAGYNTSTALLRSRVPAVVVPSTRVSDQSFRAQRFADAGLAVVVSGHHDADPDVLARAIEAAIDRPRPMHTLDLDGARATRRIIEQVASGGPG